MLEEKINCLVEEYEDTKTFMKDIISNITPSGKISKADNIIIKAYIEDNGISQNEFITDAIRYYLKAVGATYNWSRNEKIVNFLKPICKDYLLNSKKNLSQNEFQLLCFIWQLKEDVTNEKLDLLNLVLEDFSSAEIRRFNNLIDIRNIMLDAIKEIEED